MQSAMGFLAVTIVASGHSGTARPRTAPELSDAALFVMAVVGVIVVRRALRARFAKVRAARKD